MRTERRTNKIGGVGDGFCTRSGATRKWVSGAGPVPTKSSVEYENVLEEMALHVTGLPRKECCRRTPVVRVGLLGINVDRNLVTREVPSTNARRVPEMRKDATTDLVEPLTVAARVGVEEGAAGVVRATDRAAGIDDLCGGQNVPADESVVESAAFGGVKRVLVDDGVVYALDDVDFASFWPVWTDGPPSRPDRAPNGHGGDVRDEETGVECLLAVNADAGGWTLVCGACVLVVALLTSYG